MTEDDLKQFLEENADSIKEAVKAKTIERLMESHRWQITEGIGKVVQEFVSKEIVPEIKNYLASQKGPILKAALVGAAEIGENISKAITARAAKNITPDSYQFRSVMEALFK